MIHVAVVEDDPLAAELLTDYISTEDMKVVQHYPSAEQAIADIPRLPLPDVILMDIGLPGMDGIEATQKLKQRFDDLEILMLTTFEDTGTIVRAIKAGASGYMLKASRSHEICAAIREVKRGGSMLSGSVARKLVSEFQQTPPNPKLEEKPNMPNMATKIKQGTVNSHQVKGFRKLSVRSGSMPRNRSAKIFASFPSNSFFFF